MKKPTIILTVLAAAIVLSACSGVIGGENTVVFSLNDGRYVSTSANEGYVVALKKDKVYSMNQFEGEAFSYLENDQVVIANLPVGDYVFGVVLQNSGSNVGFAVKEHTVTRGLNTLSIEVAPGITNCTIEGISGDIFDFENPPDEIGTLEFSENTATINYDRPTGGTTVTFQTTFGVATPPLSSAPIGGGTYSGGSGNPVSGVLSDDAEGVEFTCSYSGQDYTYRLILK